MIGGILAFINIASINIDKEREIFMKHFEHLRDEFFNILNQNVVFKQLSNGKRIEGSYGDNLKVKRPDEFDFVFPLRLPESKYLIVTRDPCSPGHITINLADVLEIIKRQPHHRKTYELLKSCTDQNYYLSIEKLQSWLQSLFHKAIANMHECITVEGHMSGLKYKRQGPAHTIFVKDTTDKNLNYSVDFVPSIKIYGQKFEAIPKPVKGCTCSEIQGMISFRVGHYQEECELTANCNALKNALRLMKKFRDSHSNLANLKSYYIKTLFLWKIRSEETNSSYWSRSLETIILDMFGSLEECLTEKRLPFFWDTRLNLFEHLSDNQLTAMLQCVKANHVIIRNAINHRSYGNCEKIFTIFLTREERKRKCVMEFLKPPKRVRLNWAKSKRRPKKVVKQQQRHRMQCSSNNIMRNGSLHARTTDQLNTAAWELPNQQSTTAVQVEPSKLSYSDAGTDKLVFVTHCW